MNVSKGGFVILDGTVDVPSDNGLLAGGGVWVDGQVAEAGELGLVVRLLEEGGGILLLAPLQGGDELLLSGGGVVGVGTQVLLQHDLGGNVGVRVGQRDAPHLAVVGLLEDLGQTCAELGERRLDGLGGGSGGCGGFVVGGGGGGSLAVLGSGGRSSRLFGLGLGLRIDRSGRRCHLRGWC